MVRLDLSKQPLSCARVKNELSKQFKRFNMSINHKNNLLQTANNDISTELS